jgi:predicted dienelactone hydrolase
MGHSFGGYTTLATAGAELDDLDALCATKGGTPCAVAELWNNGWGDGSTPVQLGDDRVWAAVALSPWHADVLSSAGTAAVGVPTFVFSGDRDLTTPWEDVAELYSGLTTEPKHLGELIDGGHYSFSPIGCSLVEGDGCGGDYLATDRVEALTNHAVTAFLEGVRGVNTVFPIEAVEIQWP